MPEIIRCPECLQGLRIPDLHQGQQVRCPSCQAQFQPDSADPLVVSITDAPDNPGPAQPPPTMLSEADPDDLPRRRSESRRRPLSPSFKKSSRMRWVLAIGLPALILFLVALVVVGKLYLADRQKQNTLAAKKRAAVGKLADDDRDEIKQAFLPEQPPLAPDEIAQELKALFTNLGAAYTAADANKVLALYDLNRMFDEVAAAGVFPQDVAKNKRGFAKGVREAKAKAMPQQSQVMQWKAFEIRNVKKLNNNEAEVIVRHEHPKGSTLKLRWWVTRQTGAWKIYDMEDLDVGLRVSTTTATVVEQGVGRVGPLAAAMTTLREALMAMAVQEDPDAAEQKLRQIAAVKLPKPLEALRFVVQALIRLHRGQAREALEAVGQARALRPDMPILDLLEGTAYNRLGQWDKSLKHAEAYRNLLGEDAAICQLLGESLQGLKRFAEAVQAFRKSLDFNPKNADAFQGFLRSLSWQEKLDDVGPRFARLDNPHVNFEIFAADCEEMQFDALQEQLALAMKKIDPNFAPVNYYLALSKARGQQADQALALFKAALAQQQDAAKRQEYTQGFLKAAAGLGKAVDAYAAVTDARLAFHLLAPPLLTGWRLPELKQLLALHAKKESNDPLLPLYQAGLDVQEGRYAVGDKAFAAAIAKLPKDEEDAVKLFRSSRVLARFHTGLAMSAYREIGPREETFLQLVQCCFQERDYAQLQALLDAHGQFDANNADVPRFRVCWKLRENKTAEGIALFKASLARPMEDNKRNQLINEFLTEMVQAGKVMEGYQAAPNAEYAFQYLADQMEEEGTGKDLRRLVEAHRAGHPADPMLAYYQGLIHVEDKAWDRAAEVFAEGLKKVPKDRQESFQSQYRYAAYKAGRGLQAYAETPARDIAFAQLANLLVMDKNGAGLEALIKLHRPHAGDAADLAWHEVQAKVLLKQPVHAVALFQKLWAKAGDENVRQGRLSRFVLDMADIDQGVPAYRAVADKPRAFQTLAQHLLFRKKEKELAALLEEHGKANAEEAMYRFYRGELELLRGDAKQAEPYFAAALARGLLQDQWRLRNGLFRVRIKLGQAVRAYQEVEPGPATFEAVAHLCLQDKDAKQLQALLDAYRQAHADDVNLPGWDVQVRWLNKDYEGVVKALTENREQLSALPRFRWQFGNYLVRGLVKLGRARDAVQEAEALEKKKAGNPIALVLAHASTGDVKQTIAVLEKLRVQPYTLRSCYQDEDLGALLQSEPFRELREKFPRPKDVPDNDRDLDEF
jgi:hypothetical protein